MTDAIAAPAPTETATTQTASHAAVVADDFGAFRAAERAEARGTPQPDVPVPPPAEPVATEPPPEPARTLSKRQQEQNERVRLAVERATADLRAENERLKATAPKETPAPPAPKPAPYKAYLELPGAPKLADFESLEEHSAAMAVFIADQRLAEREAVRAAEADARAAGAEAVKTLETYQGQIAAAGGTAFLDQLTPEVQQLRPVEALQARGETAIGPLNVLTSEIIKSAIAPQLLQHFSDHPEELRRFETLPHPAAVYRELGKLERALEPPSPSSASYATPPKPPRILEPRPAAAADPVRAALDRNDFRAFRAAERVRPDHGR